MFQDLDFYLLVAAVGVMAAYVGVTIQGFGVPPSLSESFYLLNAKRKSLGYVFTGVCWVEAILTVMCLFDLSEGHWFQFTGFLAGAGLLLVGAAPLFKVEGDDKMEHRAHVAGASLCGGFSQLWVILMGMWYLPLVFLVAASVVIWKKGNRMFWFEMAAFVSTYTGLFIQLLRG